MKSAEKKEMRETKSDENWLFSPARILFPGGRDGKSIHPLTTMSKLSHTLFALVGTPGERRGGNYRRSNLRLCVILLSVRTSLRFGAKQVRILSVICIWSTVHHIKMSNLAGLLLHCLLVIFPLEQTFYSPAS